MSLFQENILSISFRSFPEKRFYNKYWAIYPHVWIKTSIIEHNQAIWYIVCGTAICGRRLFLLYFGYRMSGGVYDGFWIAVAGDIHHQLSENCSKKVRPPIFDIAIKDGLMTIWLWGQPPISSASFLLNIKPLLLTRQSNMYCLLTWIPFERIFTLWLSALLLKKI